MTDAGFHHEVITQILIDRFGFCRGLNDDESFTHIHLYLIKFFQEFVARCFTFHWRRAKYIVAATMDINRFYNHKQNISLSGD
jgi:hypothetical protein